MNYFSFYNFPVSFQLDTEALRQEFLALSKKYHPDFYTMESDEKQAEILELSTINNEAYKVLKDAEKRMKYVLELKNLLGNHLKPELPQTFLMEMMDINERVMDLQFDYEAAVHQTIEKEISQKEAELKASVQPILDSYNDATATQQQLEAIRDYYFQNRYLLRLKENLQKLV